MAVTEGKNYKRKVSFIWYAMPSLVAMCIFQGYMWGLILDEVLR